MASQTRNHDVVPKQPPESGGQIGDQGSRPAAVFRVDLTGASGRPIIHFPLNTMKDSNTPATKADIMGLEKCIGQRFDKIDDRLDGIDDRLAGIDDRFDNLVERMESGFDAVTERIDRVLAILQNDKERLDDHEKRLTKLEVAVGIAS